MPQYLMLIYMPAEGGPTPEEMAEMGPRWDAFTEGLQEAGLFLAGDALQSTTSATTIRERNSETQITDGPFAETKEALGGYYLVDAPDLDTVLEHAKEMPNVRYGSVEVRPIWDRSSAPD
jgi:hypothetical protein